MVLRLEELVEALQDRRRKVDQTIRQQLQQVEDRIKRGVGSEVRNQHSRNKFPFVIRFSLVRPLGDTDFTW